MNSLPNCRSVCCGHARPGSGRDRQGTRAVGVQPVGGRVPDPPGIVADLHKAGVAVKVWTVDDAARWKALETPGVDGIITNRPSELAGWNAAFAQRVKRAATS